MTITPKPETRSQRYYRRHREARKAAAREWGRHNRTRKCATTMAWFAKNPGKRAEAAKRFRARHPEKIAEGHHRRWVRKRSAKTLEQFTREEIYERDNWQCGICGKDVVRGQQSLDHVVPLSKGGLHKWSNVRLAHHACNRKRQANVSEADLGWLASRGWEPDYSASEENKVIRKRRPSPCGEANHRSRLTDEIVLEIRRRRAAGETLASVASMFGLTDKHVSQVARGEIWKHLLRAGGGGTPQ